MPSLVGYTLIALLILSAVVIVIAKFLLKKSWRETAEWLVEFFS